MVLSSALCWLFGWELRSCATLETDMYLVGNGLFNLYSIDLPTENASDFWAKVPFAFLRDFQRNHTVGTENSLLKGTTTGICYSHPLIVQPRIVMPEPKNL